MFTTLLKVLKSQADNGIIHTRKNGSFVQKLLTKDADFIYVSNSYLGNSYAFFIIEAEDYDKVMYDNQVKYLLTPSCYCAYDIYAHSCKIDEMCYQLLQKGKEFPSKFYNLLKDSLYLYFNKVIKIYSNGFNSFNSYDIWENYQWILEYLGENANNYVSQNIINKFIHELIEAHEVQQVELISRSKFIDFSLENIEDYFKATQELDDTILIAKNLISKKSYSDIRHHTLSGEPRISIYVDCTPCGELGIHIHLGSEKLIVLLYMYNDFEYSPTIIDISEECIEFESNFKK